MLNKLITVLFLILSLSSNICAQVDSSNNDMTKFRPALRVGAGLTPKFYLELGTALHRCRSNPPNSISHNIYTAVEATTTNYQDRGFLLLAPKIGYQFHAIFYAIAIEAKYLSDGKNNDLVLAPKAGFSILGMADLMYGYQISFNQNPFPGIDVHQFSLVFTLYKMKK